MSEFKKGDQVQVLQLGDRWAHDCRETLSGIKGVIVGSHVCSMDQREHYHVDWGHMIKINSISATTRMGFRASEIKHTA